MVFEVRSRRLDGTFLRSACIAAAISIPGASGEAQQKEEYASPRLAELVVATSDDRGAVERFWAMVTRDGTPLVEPSAIEGESILTFVYRGDPDIPVRLTSPIWALAIEGLPDFDTVDLLRVLPGTDVHYASFRVRDRLRLSYGFEVGDGDERRTVRDPLNPNVYMPGTRFEESSVTLPAAPPQPWAAEPAPGTWREHRIESSALGVSRPVRVYTPERASAGDAAAPYSVLIGLDAISYADILPTSRVVEYLMREGAIPPTLVVAAPDLAWVGDELGSYDPATAFLADELLPMLRREYEISDSSADVVVSGLSRRGMISAYAALTRPDAIGRVLSLSGSFYWRPPDHPQFEWVPARYAEAPRADVRLYLAAGELETIVTPTNRGHYLVATNRHMRDVLRAKGYEHRYREFYGVHSTFNWQDELAPGLAYLLGRNPD